MRIHEYQAKEILARFGVPVPRGRVAATPAEARAAAESVGGPVVVKAQVHSGARGKAGGVRTAASPDEAKTAAAALLGTRLVTKQTGPGGLPVGAVLVEEALPPATELYLGVTIDNCAERLVVMASARGGVEIEAVAASDPAAVLREAAHPVAGFLPYQARNLARGLALRGPAERAFVAAALSCIEAFRACDASLVEINPAGVLPDGRVLALDAKMTLDDNALARHPDLRALRDPGQESPLETRAAALGLSYVKLDGSVGCMVNGAGLAMATMDAVRLAGGRPANFLDVGGGASEDAVMGAFEILSSDPDVRSALVNIFGGIVRCDLVARGIVRATERSGVAVPLVVRLLGTNAAEGREILRASGLPVHAAEDMSGAAKAAVEFASGARRPS